VSNEQTQAIPAAFRLLNFKIQETHLTYADESAKEEGHVSYNIDFSPSGRLSRAQGQFVLLLSIKITSTPDTFNAQLVGRGLFAFNTELPGDQLDKLLALNSTAMVFPYVRAYISGLTALSGYPTITIPTYNLAALAEPLRSAIVEVDTL